MSVGLGKHFAFLNAPLRNSRWSWGSERDDGTIVLRVWQDQRHQADGKNYVRLTHHEAYTDDPDNLGHRERVTHVERVKGGATAYAVMCTPKDAMARPREVGSFDRRELILLGELREIGGNIWGEIAGRVPVSIVR
ncbi:MULTISPECIES: hypothetical protein [unclassified Sphingobium]|uniref:hypothetical protein n=1 Tax=unclassified Sphingobium TaxID=2611147 RepID=UPI0009715489|nr:MULTISPECIES: hypothetical protein [unclassified Sphingobium]